MGTVARTWSVVTWWPSATRCGYFWKTVNRRRAGMRMRAERVVRTIREQEGSRISRTRVSHYLPFTSRWNRRLPRSGSKLGSILSHSGER
jgi:hypothetical protein